MYEEAAKGHYFFIPESSPRDPASRTRCYSIAERLAPDLDVEVLGLAGDPFNFVGLGVQSLLKLLGLFPTLRRLRGRAVLFVQRGQSNLPKVLALAVLRRIVGSRIVFDFDDAIFVTEPRATRFLCREADAVIVANHYLADYVSRYNSRVTEIPTSVDLRVYSLEQRRANPRTVVGWAGSPANLRYLSILERPLRELRAKHDFVFRIVTDLRWSNRIPLGRDVPFEVVGWSLQNFRSALSAFDVGVAPLTDDAWTRGKAGYRVLEYMALAVPAVASDVGENRVIIDDGVNGFLVDDPAAWVARLGDLLENADLRLKIARAGRRKVEQFYSVDQAAERTAVTLGSVLDEVAAHG